MKRFVAVLALLGTMLCLPRSSGAQVAYQTCTLTSNAATICLSKGGTLVGVYNNSATAQTASLSCYDGLAATGTPIVTLGPMGAALPPVVWPNSGKGFFTALTCKLSAAPTGNGVDVYIHPGVSPTF